MASDAYQWTCPYCGRPTTLTEHNYTFGQSRIDIEVSEHGEKIGLGYTAIACPNPTCKKLTLTVELTTGDYQPGGGWRKSKEIHSWDLLPESSAKPQPDYIPEPLRDDYIEACRIAGLSPKASATLSRRCLQGMIRDFWRTPKKPNLKQEIEAIQDKVDPGTWAAIDAVRRVGNIGAHMERDINVIVDVEPREAELLIGLVETLFREWYVGRHERDERMRALVQLAADKDEDREGEGAPKEEGEDTPKGDGESA